MSELAAAMITVLVMLPGFAVMVSPSGLIVMIPGFAVMVSPDRFIVMNPGFAVMVSPDRSIVMNPGFAVMVSPDRSIVMNPGFAVMVSPDRSIVMNPCEDLAYVRLLLFGDTAGVAALGARRADRKGQGKHARHRGSEKCNQQSASASPDGSSSASMILDRCFYFVVSHAVTPFGRGKSGTSDSDE